jgi:hypothetical protein
MRLPVQKVVFFAQEMFGEAGGTGRSLRRKNKAAGEEDAVI